MLNLNIHDFRQFVTGTYVRVLGCSAAPLGTSGRVLGSEVPEPDDDEMIRIETPKGVITLEWNEARKVIVLDFPDRGLFNHDKRALMAHRHVVKQFGKSTGEANSYVYDPIMFMTPSKRRARHPMKYGVQRLDNNHDALNFNLTPELFESLMFRVYPDTATAINQLRKDYISVALSECYALAASVRTDVYLFPLIQYDTPIGMVLWKRNITITPSHADFVQNCNDFAATHLKGLKWTPQT